MTEPSQPTGDPMPSLRFYRALARLIQPQPRAPFDPAGVRRILVYGSMGIGNMVMFTPTLKAVRRRYPDAHITLLVRRHGSEKVLRGSGLVDEVIRTRRNNWETLRLALRLRRRHYDLVISTFHGLPFRAITGLAGIPWRVGHTSSPGWPHKYDFLYNVQVPMGAAEHEIDRYLRLARPVAAEGPELPAEFYLTSEDKAEADAFLQGHGVGPDDLLVGIQVDSSRGTEWRRWPLENFAAVANALGERYGARIVPLGSARTFADFDKLLERLRAPAIHGVENMELGPAAAVVQRCRFIVCNDSGFMHVAAGVGTPVIAILGPTDPGRTGPARYGPRHVVVRKDVPCGPCYGLQGSKTAEACPDRICLSRITLDDVLAEVDAMVRAVSPDRAGGS